MSVQPAANKDYTQSPLLMGILNLTPDSFSDGGLYTDAQTAWQQAEKMIYEGADIIDIGAESTRPGAKLISADEEWQRLEGFMKLLRKKKPTQQPGIL